MPHMHGMMREQVSSVRQLSLSDRNLRSCNHFGAINVSESEHGHFQ
jgi:hypothetical protein